MLGWNELKQKINAYTIDKQLFFSFSKEIIKNIEYLVIEDFKNDESENDDEFCKLYLAYMAELPLGSWSSDFYYAVYDSYGKLWSQEDYKPIHLMLRALCEEYISEFRLKNTEPVEEILLDIEDFLKKIKINSYSIEGTKLPYEDLHSTPLLKFIYQSSYLDLIRLLKKYIPMPNASYFGNLLPPIITKSKQNDAEIIKNVFANSKMNFPIFENHIITLQRKYRANKRQQEEKCRIPKRYMDVLKNNDDSLLPHQDLYIPKKCSKSLSDKIINVAKHVKFIKNIRHETKMSAIKSIFDEGLYGRRTLLQFFMPFTPAALKEVDVDNGDGNAICFGTQFIDNNTNSEIELYLEFNKINFKPFHCAFFKQFDFGIDAGVESVKSIKLGNEKKIMFYPDTECRPLSYKGTATGISLRNIDDRCKDLKDFYFPEISAIPNYQLISYDVDNIHAVLILNFFRLLENLKPIYCATDSCDIANIYNEIEKLTDQELFEFLKDVGEKSTCWMEFNFYGAHLIDFDTLICVKNKINKQLLNIRDLINDLNNNHTTFSTIIEKFPEVFSSYRFLDYLVSKIDNLKAINEIYDRYLECKVPSWFPINKKFQLLFEANINESSNSNSNSEDEDEELNSKKRKREDNGKGSSVVKKIKGNNNLTHKDEVLLGKVRFG